MSEKEKALPRVLLETEHGAIMVELDEKAVPISTSNFLNYVDQRLFDGAEFYRTAYAGENSEISIVQGGIKGDGMRAKPIYANDDNRPSSLDPIVHEPTNETGLKNTRGSIAYGRFEPGTASSEFFFNMADNVVLDAASKESLDGLGYAVFGKVVEGMNVLEIIQALPSDASASSSSLQGQILDHPVIIKSATRVVVDRSQ